MRIASAIICLSLSFAWVPFACSSQAEGQRCNIDNGNDDCDEGLVCTSSRDLGGNADICCPASGVSTAPDCARGGTSASSTSGTGGGGGAGGGGSTSSGGGMGGDGGGGGPSSSTASAMGGGGMSQGGGGMSQGGAGGAGGN